MANAYLDLEQYEGAINRCEKSAEGYPQSKLIGDVPSATAILNRFLHHAEIIQITGNNYRLRDQAIRKQESNQSAGKTNSAKQQPAD